MNRRDERSEEGDFECELKTDTQDLAVLTLTQRRQKDGPLSLELQDLVINLEEMKASSKGNDPNSQILVRMTENEKINRMLEEDVCKNEVFGT